MFKDTFKPIPARASHQTIQVFQPTLPRMRAPHRIVTAIALTAAFVIIADISIVRAETGLSTEVHTMTFAQAAPSGSGNGRDRPPREAIEACSSQPADATCSFAGRDGKQISGTCRSPKSDAPAACVPAQMPQDG